MGGWGVGDGEWVDGGVGMGWMEGGVGMGWMEGGVGMGWMEGGVGGVGAPTHVHTTAHAHMHAHTHVQKLQMAADMEASMFIMFIMFMHVRACMYMRVCACMHGTLPHTPIPTPHLHPPICHPQGGLPESVKIQ